MSDVPAAQQALQRTFTGVAEPAKELCSLLRRPADMQRTLMRVVVGARS